MTEACGSRLGTDFPSTYEEAFGRIALGKDVQIHFIVVMITEYSPSGFHVKIGFVKE
jgi:hypothetical protein